MIGFDIGTFQSKVSYVDQTGKPQPVANARGEYATPSVLLFQNQDEPLIGRDAIEQGFVDPALCVRNFKLGLGTTVNLLNNGLTVTPTDATGLLIGRLKKDLELVLGTEVKEAVATCPANFRDDAKQALLEAFAGNGIEILRLVPEPTAAGLAYALDKQHALNYVVFDFGGGTLDVSVIRVEGAGMTVLATDGVHQLGGKDLNDRIMARVLDQVATEFKQRPTQQQEPLFFHDLEQRVENAKISLSNRKEVPIVAAFNGSQVVVRITQEEFHKDIDPLIRQSLDTLDKAVAAAGLKKDQIGSLVMVGGTSRMPYLQDVVANHVGLRPKTDIDPEKAIAFGAALACLTEMAKKGKKPFVHGRAIPTPDVFVRDVTAHPIGCCVADKSGPAKRLLQAVIIPKNTPIPCQRIDSFYLEHEDQTEAHIEILQGEPDADRDDCLLIGEIRLDNLPKETVRTQRIQVEYVIDGNGMVTATATDKVSGRQNTVSVDYKKGIKPKDKPKAA
jgi:molecular chaperone DnaK